MAEPRRGGTVVVGIVRREGSVLLVRHDDEDGTALWSLPGGVVEEGEMLHEALLRELAEETGLDGFQDCGRLAWVSQNRLEHPEWGGLWTAVAFDLPSSVGELSVNDPDDLVREARFMPFAEALSLLTAHPSRVMGEPAAAFLAGRTTHGALWFWETTGGTETLLECDAGTPA